MAFSQSFSAALTLAVRSAISPFSYSSCLSAILQTPANGLLYSRLIEARGCSAALGKDIVLIY